MRAQGVGDAATHAMIWWGRRDRIACGVTAGRTVPRARTSRSRCTHVVGSYTFDAGNRLKTRTYGGATTAYTYDGNGTMVKSSTAGASGSETTVYVGGGVSEKNIALNVTTKYYGAGRPIAMRKTGRNEPFDSGRAQTAFHCSPWGGGILRSKQQDPE